MSDMADVLADHYPSYKWDRDHGGNVWVCTSLECSATSETFGGIIAHQAAALSAAGFGPVREAKREAFEQGQKSGKRYAARRIAAARIGRPDLPGPISPNPYAEDT